MLLALLSDGSISTLMTLLWALSPLLGCMSLGLPKRVLSGGMPLVASVRLMLPHIGRVHSCYRRVGLRVTPFHLASGRQICGWRFVFCLPLVMRALYSFAVVCWRWRVIWAHGSYTDLALVVIFMLVLDSTFKVGLRQPYSGVDDLRRVENFMMLLKSGA